MAKRIVKRAYVETYGCQMNVSDSEVVAAVLRDAGYGRSASAADADVVAAHDASKPLFLYFAPTACHGPVVAPLELMERRVKEREEEAKRQQQYERELREQDRLRRLEHDRQQLKFTPLPELSRLRDTASAFHKAGLTLEQTAALREASKRAGFDAMLETVQNEAVANWVLKRITLGKNQVGIKRLDADEYEGDATLPDPGIGKYVPRAEPRVKIDMDSFMGDISAVQQQSAESRRATTAARRMSQQLTVAIDAFSSLAAGKNGLGKGSVRNKYVRAVLRWIRKQQVKEMSDMLDSSAFYQDMVTKKAEERAAEPAG